MPWTAIDARLPLGPRSSLHRSVSGSRFEAVERGSTLRQLVIDALQREMTGAQRPRKRLTRPPIKLAADAPLPRLSPEAVKRLDAEDLQRSEEAKARALRR